MPECLSNLFYSVGVPMLVSVRFYLDNAGMLSLELRNRQPRFIGHDQVCTALSRTSLFPYFFDTRDFPEDFSN